MEFSSTAIRVLLQSCGICTRELEILLELHIVKILLILRMPILGSYITSYSYHAFVIWES